MLNKLWDGYYGISLCIVIPFVLAIIALHTVTKPEKKFWSLSALVFSILYAVFVTANYVVQLATVIPAKVNNRLNEIKILDQIPHSMFWNFDVMGYIFMGIVCLLTSKIFSRTSKEIWVKTALLANALVTPLICIVYFYPVYSEQLLKLGYIWGITAPGFMLMLALYFYNSGRTSKAI